jgi:hypothetical protein
MLTKCKDFKVLSNDDKKLIVGGAEPASGYLYAGGQCTGSVGEWVMTPPSASTENCLKDIEKYCSSGRGSCTFTPASTLTPAI